MCVPTLVLSLFSPNALEARRSAHALERRPQASRRALLLGAAAVPLLAASSPATAAFGPAVGSAASQPPITPLDVEGWLALTPEKLLQRARSVSGSQARSLQEQIDDAFSAEKLEALIASLQEQGTVAASPALASELEVLRQRLQRSVEAKELRKQLKAREELSSRLDAQPAVIVYGAALVASLTSTSIMHPVSDACGHLGMGADW